MKLNNGFSNHILNCIIIIDIVLISLSTFITLTSDILFAILCFDFFVCIFLLIDWSNELYHSQPKSAFLKKPSTWVSLIASIHLQVLLPTDIFRINFLRYFRLSKLFRILILFDKFFDCLKNFIKRSKLHKYSNKMLN